MKAGGVKFADTPEEAESHAREILQLEIGGHMPRGVLVDPRAEVELLDEAVAARDAHDARPDVERLLKRVLAMAAELGEAPQAVGVELHDDPAQAAFEAAAAAPIGPLDAQRLLELDDPGDRLAQLRGLLAEQAELLELRLSGS